MYYKLGFEAAVAVLLTLAGIYLQRSGLPGTALILVGVLLGAISITSRISLTGSASRLITIWAGNKSNQG